MGPDHRPGKIPGERGGGGEAGAGSGRPEPGPARLYALAAGAFLALLGVLGFFFDSSFGSGQELTSDDLAGTLLINGWRNALYLGTGLLALGLAGARPRLAALGLGGLYLGVAIWGLAVTERGIGSIADLLPLGDLDNLLHLVLGVLGILAALIDGGLPRSMRKPRIAGRGLRRGRAGSRRDRANPPGDAGDAPR